jgi:hypothetical protein
MLPVRASVRRRTRRPALGRLAASSDGGDAAGQQAEGRVDPQRVLEELRGGHQRGQRLLEVSETGTEVTDLDLDVLGSPALTEVDQLSAGHAQERQRLATRVLTGRTAVAACRS